MVIRFMKNNMVWYYIEIDKASVGALRYGNYTTAGIILMAFTKYAFAKCQWTLSMFFPLSSDLTMSNTANAL